MHYSVLYPQRWSEGTGDCLVPLAVRLRLVNDVGVGVDESDNVTHYGRSDIWIDV